MTPETTPIDDTRMRRVLDFLQRLDAPAADEVGRWSGGVAVISPSLPRVWDANYFRLDRPEGRDPAELAAEASEIAARRGIKYTTIVVTDEAAAAALAPGLRGLGFEVDRTAVMALASQPDPPTAPVEPATFADVAPSRRELTLELREDAELARELGELDRRFEATVGGRWFAVREAGVVIARAWLVSDGATAQVEDVATARAARGRGLARAVVSAAARAAIAEGRDLVFVLTNADETTPELYRKVGFEPIGLTYRFVRPVR